MYIVKTSRKMRRASLACSSLALPPSGLSFPSLSSITFCKSVTPRSRSASTSHSEIACSAALIVSIALPRFAADRRRGRSGGFTVGAEESARESVKIVLMHAWSNTSVASPIIPTACPACSSAAFATAAGLRTAMIASCALYKHAFTTSCAISTASLTSSARSSSSPSSSAKALTTARRSPSPLGAAKLVTSDKRRLSVVSSRVAAQSSNRFASRNAARRAATTLPLFFPERGCDDDGRRACVFAARGGVDCVFETRFTRGGAVGADDAPPAAPSATLRNLERFKRSSINVQTFASRMYSAPLDLNHAKSAGVSQSCCCHTSSTKSSAAFRCPSSRPQIASAMTFTKRLPCSRITAGASGAISTAIACI